MAADPELAFRLLARLGDRVRTLVARLDSQTAHSATARLAALILRRQQGVTDTFTLGATHAAIADELGTVREMIVRGLRTLREEGIVEAAGRGRLRVLDLARLRALASSIPG